MTRITGLAAAAFGFCLAMSGMAALGQQVDTPMDGSYTQDKQPVPGMSQSEVTNLANYIDLVNQQNGKNRPIPKKSTAAAQKAAAIQDKADAEGLVQQIRLGCTVADASAVAEGTISVGGHNIATRTYEVACNNGMGYFLVSANPEKPFGFSCFAAAAAAEADAAKGRQGDIVCTLPTNANLNAMAETMLAGQGKRCAVKSVSWMGISNKTGSDYTEAACADGTGYILETALPGATGATAAIGCADAPKEGLRCQMTKVAAAEPITLQTFVQALNQHGIACQPTDERVIGKENVLKRHVVEFACPNRPKGLVAFIPLADSTAKFEVLDCAQARKRGIACKLTE